MSDVGQAALARRRLAREVHEKAKRLAPKSKVAKSSRVAVRHVGSEKIIGTYRAKVAEELAKRPHLRSPERAGFASESTVAGSDQTIAELGKKMQKTGT